MCGIVGYIGENQACDILLAGLGKLEYRGYDSAGIAINNGSEVNIVKKKGRIKDLTEAVAGLDMSGTYGIGHTRWATHGEPNETNAHPHKSDKEKLVLVHNGIIENYEELKFDLEKKGYMFYTQTDTEVIANLVDYYYKGNPIEAIRKATHYAHGSYALGIMFSDIADKIYCIRKESPLIIGLSSEGQFLASDVTAILNHTRQAVYMNDDEIAILTKDSATFFNTELEEIKKEITTIIWDSNASEKGGYSHFMMKEIMEQPKAVKDTIMPRIKNGSVNISELDLSEEEIKQLNKIYIVACGSAYHVGVNGKYTIEGISRISVEVDIASEFRYRNPIFEKNSLFIVMSQSGETADSLAALRLAKQNGVKTLAVVNVVGSSIAREADMVLYTHAGAEISVATTKAYSAQLATLYLLATQMGFVRGTIDKARYEELINSLIELPEKIEETLGMQEDMQKLSMRLAIYKDFFFIGRGIDYATSMEGSLKLKEISYLRSEAYAAGELKHGTISLMEPGVLVVGLVTQKGIAKKTVSNLIEVAARHADVMVLATKGMQFGSNVTERVISVPEVEEYFSSSVAVIPLQLLSYYISCYKGLDVDKPRNLAKSVTVE